jgi:hypothetical protein
MNSHIYGSITAAGLTSEKAYEQTTAPFVFTGKTHSDTLLWYSQIDVNTSIEYVGEYVMYKFPFNVDLTQVYFNWYQGSRAPKHLYFMGSLDGGTTFELIRDITATINTLTHTENFSALPKYNCFKLICYEFHKNGNQSFTLKDLRFFGDIYIAD